MPQILSEEEARRHAAREEIAVRLDEITAAVTERMKRAGYDLPLMIAVPGSGAALLSFATPTHPSEEDWQAVSNITSAVIADLLDRKLRTVDRPCAGAGAAFTAADIVARDESKPDTSRDAA